MGNLSKINMFDNSYFVFVVIATIKMITRDTEFKEKAEGLILADIEVSSMQI